jgi:hypothetical protein
MIRGRRTVLALVLALGTLVPSTAGASIPAPPSQWYGLPGLNAGTGASWVRAFATSTPPNVLYAGLEGGGVFRSVDGGATWSPFNAGFANPAATNVRGLLTSSTGTTVYAATDSGVWKSTGGGAWAAQTLNASAQALLSPSGSPETLLAGVLSGGVYRSSDGGATWSAPAADNGMPASETIWSLTANLPGLIYATGASGVYVSTDTGATWTRKSDGIPASASPLTTWGFPQRPQILFTSTASNGVYRSLNAGLTWAPINDGLGAVRARGLQVFTAAGGAHLYAATENGLWEALDQNAVAPPPPRWHQVTQEGLIEPGASNTTMWALTAPAIPGAGSLGLIAGTQSNGGYFLSFEPPDSTCSVNNPNTTVACPRISGTNEVGNVLTALNGQWTGTDLKSYAYQWERCTGATADTCTSIAGAEETTYLVPETALDTTPHLRYRVEITASNPAPTFGVVHRYSTLTAAAVANAGAYPGSNQTSAPSISVLAPGTTTQPVPGDQMYAEFGVIPSPTTDGWFNPKATSITYQWLRCDGSGQGCDEIAGATGRTYTVQTADGTHDLRVRVRGTNSAGSAEVTSPASYDVISAPAAIGDPLPPDMPGGPAKSQAPALVGDAYVGETLAGTVGGWQDPTTDYLRRWLRCDAAGNACTPIQKAGSVDPETGPTYVVRADDVGSTLRLRVTADVNGDLTPDGLDNHLPHAVEVDTAASAVVTVRLSPAGPGPGAGAAGGGAGTAGRPGSGGGGTVARDTSAPRLSSVKLTKKRFAAGTTKGKGTAFRMTVSERATLRIVVAKPTTGRKVGTACKPRTKANRRRKSCTFAKPVLTLRRTVAAGPASIAFTGMRTAKRKLAAGRYTATLVATDAAGNASTPVVVAFVIRRR